MKSKHKNLFFTFLLGVLLLTVFYCLTGRAGNLEPDGSPQPTMVTLSELSAQIQALSSPVEKVVRGVITFPNGQSELSQGFSPAVDPNNSAVLLSDAVATSHPTTEDTWIGRTGTVVVNLTDSQITVRVEPNPVEQKVSYQIIEYK